MFTVKASGSIAGLVQDMRAVHGRLVPYAAATALTRTAWAAAKKDLPDAMRAELEADGGEALGTATGAGERA